MRYLYGLSLVVLLMWPGVVISYADQYQGFSNIVKDKDNNGEWRWTIKPPHDYMKNEIPILVSHPQTIYNGFDYCDADPLSYGMQAIAYDTGIWRKYPVDMTIPDGRWEDVTMYKIYDDIGAHGPRRRDGVIRIDGLSTPKIQLFDVPTARYMSESVNYTEPWNNGNPLTSAVMYPVTFTYMTKAGKLHHAALPNLKVPSAYNYDDYGRRYTPPAYLSFHSQILLYNNTFRVWRDYLCFLIPHGGFEACTLEQNVSDDITPKGTSLIPVPAMLVALSGPETRIITYNSVTNFYSFRLRYAMPKLKINSSESRKHIADIYPYLGIYQMAQSFTKNKSPEEARAFLKEQKRKDTVFTRPYLCGNFVNGEYRSEFKVPHIVGNTVEPYTGFGLLTSYLLRDQYACRFPAIDHRITLEFLRKAGSLVDLDYPLVDTTLYRVAIIAVPNPDKPCPYYYTDVPSPWFKSVYSTTGWYKRPIDFTMRKHVYLERPATKPAHEELKKMKRNYPGIGEAEAWYLRPTITSNWAVELCGEYLRERLYVEHSNPADYIKYVNDYYDNLASKIVFPAEIDGVPFIDNYTMVTCRYMKDTYHDYRFPKESNHPKHMVYYKVTLPHDGIKMYNDRGERQCGYSVIPEAEYFAMIDKGYFALGAHKDDDAKFTPNADKHLRRDSKYMSRASEDNSPEHAGFLAISIISSYSDQLLMGFYGTYGVTPTNNPNPSDPYMSASYTLPVIRVIKEREARLDSLRELIKYMIVDRKQDISQPYNPSGDTIMQVAYALGFYDFVMFLKNECKVPVPKAGPLDVAPGQTAHTGVVLPRNAFLLRSVYEPGYEHLEYKY